MRKVRIDPKDEDEPLIEEAEVGRVPEFALGPADLKLAMQTIDTMDAKQLQARIHELRFADTRSERREIRDLQTRLYFKYSIPLTAVFFIWIAFPLAIMPQRASNTRGMGIALLIILFYLGAYSVFQRLGSTGALPPELAAWTPNITLAALGWWLMEKRQRS
jgi:lipopolysaccharide export LptBFGC system permease protein LptF